MENTESESNSGSNIKIDFKPHLLKVLFIPGLDPNFICWALTLYSKGYF